MGFGERKRKAIGRERPAARGGFLVLGFWRER